jgi:hypothetical protein
MKRLEPMKMSLTVALAYGVFVLAASRVSSVLQLALLLVAGGLLMTVANTSANTFLQSQATNLNRGQTASLFMLAMRGGLSLGNLVTGTFSSIANVQLAFAVNGILAILIQAYIFRCAFRTKARA